MLWLLACNAPERTAEEVAEYATDSGTDTSVDTGSDSSSEDSAVDSGADSGTNDTGIDSDSGVIDDTADTGDPVTPSPDAVADWSLPDLNPGSERYGQAVSPRDYLSRVSGFYFVRAT